MNTPHPPFRTACAAAEETAVAAVFGVCASALDVAAGDGAQWIKIAPLGRVTGRDGRGPYDFGDVAAATAIVAATKAYLSGIDGLIDYDHAFDLAASKGLGSAPAAGWIKDWKVEADGVYSLTEWTAKAAAAVKAREYRYISPVFLFGPDGRVSKILRASLTAHPNFDMPALAHAAPASSHGVNMPLSKELAAALALPETASDADAVAALTKLKTDLASAQTATASAQAGMTAVAAVVGLAAGAAPDAVCASVAALKSGGSPDPAQYVPMAAFQEVTKALAAAQSGGVEREAAALADKLAGEGKLSPAQRGWFLALAAADPAAAKAYAATAPVIVPPGQTAPPPGEKTGGTVTLTAEQKAICAGIGVSEADYAKQLGAAQ